MNHYCNPPVDSHFTHFGLGGSEGHGRHGNNGFNVLAFIFSAALLEQEEKILDAAQEQNETMI